MSKEDWIRKLTSRKFWIAVAGFVSGLLLAFGASSETSETVTGIIMSGASVLGYLLAEGLTDAASQKMPGNVTVNVTSDQIKDQAEE